MPIIKNKQASRFYKILDKKEAGIVLKGLEVKSLRAGRASLNESHVRVSGHEAFLINAHIPAWQKQLENYEPTRSRKLLLHKSEIRDLYLKSQKKGLTLVPLQIYFKKNHAKVLIGVGRGLKKGDKRMAIKERESKREINRALRRK
ncbi:SsrA-binding protein SmpB [Patescibacteria group bacterium]|nr:SsrA-binding protein SmpB [Patescibacteria group bacterium]